MTKCPNSFTYQSRIITSLIITLIGYGTIHAQIENFDSAYLQEFNKFKESIQQEFNAFKKHNDSIFIQFLSNPWEEFKPINNKLSISSKPKDPPIFNSPEVPITPIKDSKLPEKHKQRVKEPILEILESDSSDKIEFYHHKNDKVYPPFLPKKNPVLEKATIDDALLFKKVHLYGTSFSVPYTHSALPILTSVSEQAIIEFYREASYSSLMNSAAFTLRKEANNCKLNDWGLSKLLMKAAQTMYIESNDQVVFTWFGLLCAGFNAKVGYDKQNVYLLLPSHEKLYEVSYNINGIDYYLLNIGVQQIEPEKLFIYRYDHPQSNNNLSFKILQTPDLDHLITKRTLICDQKVELNLNKNLLDFYASYPQCELKVYFVAPLSVYIIKQLDAYFIPVLKTKNDDERVSFLLNFVQQTINYQTDNQQFGFEKYMFADETIYYPAADCEDRAVLLAKLIKRYTNNPVIGLVYPSHVSLAVCLSSKAKGKYITYRNMQYYFCDPTYIGSHYGDLMPDCENVTPLIIDFN